MDEQKRIIMDAIDKEIRYRNILNKRNSTLTEQDFYPPSDDRVWTSNVEDIEDGDNFADYCKEFFELLDEEEYFDND